MLSITANNCNNVRERLKLSSYIADEINGFWYAYVDINCDELANHEKYVLKQLLIGIFVDGKKYRHYVSNNDHEPIAFSEKEDAEEALEGLKRRLIKSFVIGCYSHYGVRIDNQNESTQHKVSFYQKG